MAALCDINVEVKDCSFLWTGRNWMLKKKATFLWTMSCDLNKEKSTAHQNVHHLHSVSNAVSTLTVMNLNFSRSFAIRIKFPYDFPVHSLCCPSM